MLIHISGKDLALTSDQDAIIRREVMHLRRLCHRLVACRVVVSVPRRRPGGEPLAYALHLSFTVPGAELAVTRQGRPSFREALEEGFDAAWRQLRAFERKQRENTRTGPPERRWG